MPVAVTYANLGEYVAKKIGGLKAGGSQKLPDFLGQKAATVSQHFPSGWLNKIRVGVRSPLPAPKLVDLLKDMGYRAETDFENACKKTHQNLFPVLKMFSDPLPATLVGITYENVIWLKSGHQNDLSLIVHELVHTLQWDRFGPKGFLEKYLKGFAANYPNYVGNPAEKIAYGFQKQFTPQKAPLKIDQNNATSGM
jgi:hypothetical protein